MAKQIIRVHGDTFTQDLPITGKGPKAAQTEAQWALRDGVWVGNILYPPTRIVHIELKDI